MYKHVLVATDGSDLAARAVKHGVELALATKAKVSFLTVTEAFHSFTVGGALGGNIEDPRPEFDAFMARRAAGVLDSAARVAQSAGVPFETIHRDGDRPFEVIIDVAREQGCDLIVMATHGRQGASAVLLGSQTMRVLANTDIPVLVVR